MKIGARIAYLAAALLAAPGAFAAEPSRGAADHDRLFMPLTGGLAVNGRSGLLAMQIWAEDTNKKGGLLGRPVKLVYYDDQTNPSLVPGIYTKLLDVDKVDLVVSAYGTNVTAPAMPVVMQHNKTFMGLFAMDVNEEFRYPKYFSMLPVGPDPRAAISEGFFEIVKANKEKLGLKTIALAVDDGEATRNAADGARVNLKKAGLANRLRQDLSADDDRFHARSSARCRRPIPISSISRPIRRQRRLDPRNARTRAQHQDVLRHHDRAAEHLDQDLARGRCSTASSPSTVGCRRRRCGFPASWSFCSNIRSGRPGRASIRSATISAPWAYADLQVLGEAVEGTKGLDQDKIADYIRTHTFKTVVGDVTFGKKGEWEKARMMTVQFQNITGTSVDDFRDGKGEAWCGRAIQRRRPGPALFFNQALTEHAPAPGASPSPSR